MAEAANVIAKRIAEIRERADAATLGPWKADRRCVAFARMCPPEQNREGMYSAPYGVSISGEFVPAAGYLPTDEADATAEFIAHARDDVPWLLDYAEALRETLAELRAACDELGSHTDKVTVAIKTGKPPEWGMLSKYSARLDTVERKADALLGKKP